MIGFGYDSHRLAVGRRLVLCGVEIPYDRGPLGHSDGDAALHALCDALLGAAALGDIGEHFPDGDPAYKDAPSSFFVHEVIKKIAAKALCVINIDLTIILEEPRLMPFKAAMKANIAQLCGISPDFVNVKAKTNETMGFVGRGEGVAVFCVCRLGHLK